ncbi:hypothetical protein ['Paenibacillus yunnanensis' Narsing Rao et al. 2020]|uniref:hypothetical protein n=1 Tax=Paenibacillus tengchongensis TaxID=2608684 RepID=UPI0016523F60|nr:hypothetical protein [Paenibacillus tengchongensis]
MPSYIVIIPATIDTSSALSPTAVRNRRANLKAAVWGALKLAVALAAIAVKELVL